jgi:uncharacterized protein
MRVDKDKTVQDVLQVPGVQPKKGATESVAPFGRVLREEKSRADSKAVMDGLLGKIAEQGELIARRRDMGDIRKYRELIASFLDCAMRSAYSTDKDGSYDARGRYKEYSVVRKINEEVEKLARQALEEQRDNLAILEQLGTIRGLLIDLMI